MAEIVDSIVAELIVRDNNYTKNFLEATKVVDGHTAALKRLQDAEAKTNRSGTNTRATAAKAASAEIKKAAKETADAEKAAAKAASDAVKAAEREKQAALKATKREMEAAAKAAQKAAEIEKTAAAEAVAAAEREAATRARLAAVADRAVAHRGVPRGSGRIPNSDLSRSTTPLFVPPAALAGAGEVDDLKEVDAVTRDIAINQARLVGLQGRERDEVQRTLAYLRTYKTLKAAGVEETEAQILAERQLTAIEEHRAMAGRRGGLGNANQFLLQATRGRFGYSLGGAAIGGAVTAIGAGIGIEAINSVVKYGQALKNASEELGVTTHDLQVYQKAARDAGVSNDQLNSALGTLSQNLGKAKLGAKDESATFKALGIDIKNVANTGQLLPTLIDRLSQIENPAKRSELEVRLFGETGQKLDSLLSGGTDRVNDLAKALENTGHVLSDTQIKNLDDTARKLADVKAQLQVEFASVVASNADSIERLATSLGKLAGEVLNFLDSNPEKAVGILGAIAGFTVGGVPGAVIGGGLGLQAGIQYQEGNSGGVTLKAGPDGKWHSYDAKGNIVGEAPKAGPLPKIVVTDANGKPVSAKEQNALLSASVADARKMLGIDIQGGKPNSKAIDSLLDHSRTRRGKSASTLEREADQRTRQYQNQLGRYQDEQLRAQEDMTGDVNKRAAIEKELADRELKRQIGDPATGLVGDIDLQKQRNIAAGADKKTEEARAKALKAEAQKAHDADVARIEQQKGLDLARQANDKAQQQLEADAERLNDALSLATTTADRRRLELQLLNNAKEQERVRLEGTIKTSLPGSDEAKNAQHLLDTIDQRWQPKQDVVIRGTETSLEAYKRSLQVTADTISDFGVRALQDFNAGLDQSIAKALHLHGVFGEIVADLIDMAIKQQLISPIANSGGFGGFLGSIGKLFGLGSAAGSASGAAGVLGSGFDVGSIATDIPFAFANGGSGIIGGRPGVDQNILSINGVPQAKVGKGELLSVVNPNLGAMNQKLAAPASQQNIVVVQPITADFRGARTDEQTMRAFVAYADARSNQARDEAIRVAGSQVGGIVQRKQTLGS